MGLASASTKQPLIRGVDVSAWQGNPTMSDVARAGNRFVILKATQGLTYVSDRFLPEWDDVSEQGMARGCYHFSRFEIDPEKQAEHFVRSVERRVDEFPEIPHCWDFEPYQGAPDWQPARLVDHALRGGRRLRTLLGVKPGLYVPDWYFMMLLKGYGARGLKPAPNALELTEVFWLWLCDYSPTPRAMPWPLTPWGTPWTIWQTSGSGSVPGVVGKCDTNVFAGSEAQLFGLSDAMKVQGGAGT